MHVCMYVHVCIRLFAYERYPLLAQVGRYVCLGPEPSPCLPSLHADTPHEGAPQREQAVRELWKLHSRRTSPGPPAAHCSPPACARTIVGYGRAGPACQSRNFWALCHEPCSTRSSLGARGPSCRWACASRRSRRPCYATRQCDCCRCRQAMAAAAAAAHWGAGTSRPHSSADAARLGPTGPILSEVSEWVRVCVHHQPRLIPRLS